MVSPGLSCSSGQHVITNPISAADTKVVPGRSVATAAGDRRRQKMAADGSHREVANFAGAKAPSFSTACPPDRYFLLSCPPSQISSQDRAKCCISPRTGPAIINNLWFRPGDQIFLGDGSHGEQLV